MKTNFSRSVAAVILLVGSVVPFASQGVEIKGDPRASQIAKNVYDRPDGTVVKRKLKIELIDASGEKRERTALVIRAKTPKEKKSVIMYDSPRSIKGTAFLAKDRLEGGDARDQYLYLPSLKRERKIPNSERGDYFLGTDFTYEDVKNELKFDPSDYEFAFVAEVSGLVGNSKSVIIQGNARSDQKAKELGYSYFEATVDTTTWMIMQAEFYDVKKQPLKVVTVKDVEKIDGILSPKKILVKNQQTGHSTQFTYSDIKYSDKVDGRFFEFETIANGPKAYE